ncbi:MAG: D-alanyl-D-alanine carboxypeptidase family protein [Sedimenticolaceae bacterium]|jgi:D-alanyl-D-alanine carboxypeptidase (penicillin-binding protein 5/6)
MQLFRTLLLALFFISNAQAVVPEAPEINASGYLLMEMHSGKVLVEKNADQRLEPASLTKIMTAHVVFEEIAKGKLKLSDMVHISEKAWKTEGSRMFVKVNSDVSVEDLLRGLIIQSGNDSAVALAEHIAGSEDAFAGLMNAHAAQLGMTSTNFVNSTGLPHPDHYTTPSDIVKVTAATIRDYPDFYPMYAEKQFTYNEIKQYNRNNLLWRNNAVDGVKTGHTEAAGFCLVSSAKYDQMRLIAVVMGTESAKARIKESQALLAFGSRFYETHRLYEAGQKLTENRVWFGDQKTLALGIGEDVYVTIPRRDYDNLKPTLEVKAKLEAPINKGDSLGNVTVMLGNDVVTTRPLVALAQVEKGSLWRRFLDFIYQLLGME